jgi:predicted acetyltransferase
VSENEADYSSHTASVSYIATATDDAYAAIWRFLLELDLVGEVKAYLRPTDEPVRWQVSDYRAVRVDQNDHLWLRVLDAPTALEARTYSAPASLALDISDPLGFAEGRWLLSIDDAGAASVTLIDEVPDGAAHVAMTVNELGSLLLGGVSAVVLARAGRVHEVVPGSATVLDRSFRASSAPWLSLWF